MTLKFVFIMLFLAAAACSSEPSGSPEAHSPVESEIAGDGWRLLYSGGTEAWGTTLATDQDSYDWIWKDSGIGEEPPPVDFDTEIVLWFATGSQSCIEEFDSLVFSHQPALVYPSFLRSQDLIDDLGDGDDIVCTLEGRSEVLVAAVDRNSLPAAPFAVSPIPSGDYPRGRKLVSVDLRAPGSIATQDQFGLDPAFEKNRHTTRPLSAGEPISHTDPALYSLDLDCDFGTLGPFNTVMWFATNPELTASPPQPWIDAAVDNQVETLVFFDDDPLHLQVTAGGHTEHYEPAPTTETTDCP